MTLSVYQFDPIKKGTFFFLACMVPIWVGLFIEGKKRIRWFFWLNVHISRIQIQLNSDQIGQARIPSIDMLNPKLAKSFPILSFFNFIPKTWPHTSRCPISKPVSPKKLNKGYSKSPLQRHTKILTIFALNPFSNWPKASQNLCFTLNHPAQTL